MNKYLLRGLILILVAIGIGIWSVYLQEQDLSYFRWPMIVAVVIFGVGFLFIIYSLIRKIERRSILDERATKKSNR